MEVVKVSYLGSKDQYQSYAPQDVALINTAFINGSYGPGDYIEYFVKDLNGTVLSANYYATQYQLNDSVVNTQQRSTTQLYLDPEKDARDKGYTRGAVNVKYNFFTQRLASGPDPSISFWIKEISTSGLEIKAARQDLSNSALQNTFDTFNSVLTSDAYYPTFYLNFGADIQVIAVNAVYVEEGDNAYIIFKLYEPLPSQFTTKSTFWVVTATADSAEFNVLINVAPETVVDSARIKGPNFKVSINDKVGQTTPYYSYTSLLSTSTPTSYQQLQSLMQEKGIQINVDYSNFNNFIHFSSATERLYNFVYKVQLIESASAGLVETNTATAKVLLQNQIDTTITNFDGYEYYLYFDSASTAYPKKTSTQPYPLYSLTSSQAANWLGSIGTNPNGPATMSMYWSSSYYDDNNKDLLLYATPAYIAEDSANAPYLVFLNMIGQHFDNIWIYIKDVTNHYSAENNPFVGISMDQVADALRSFGVQLYTNTSITDNIYYSLLGLNQTGSALPVTSSAYSVSNVASSSIYPLAGQPYLTASLSLPPFGEEKINRYVISFVTGSNPSSSFATLPAAQIQGETYKRLYHNLAYLLKTRGTERGVRALITTFGIPTDYYAFTSSYDSLSGGYISASSYSEAILTPHEYGGYDIYQVPGIQEISNTKIITGSGLNISSSLLSPYTSIQYYQNDQDKSSGDIEIGFSPADSINASITSSGYVTSSTQPGYFNIMQLIGAPNLQYSSSYIPLVELANTYFSAEYTSKYNVWDFIRVIKYYNNSVFKMLRDWVPARSSASTGIIIKSHMLERNKYPRHEPTYTILSGSAQIKMVTASGSDGGAIKKNTYYVEEVPVQYQSNSIYLGNASGTIYISSSNNIQKYTGEFSGSHIAADYTYFTQEEVSSYIYPWTSSVAPSIAGGNVMFLTYSLSPTLNNVTGSVISQRFLDLDYNNNQVAPTNFGLVTQSLSQSLVIGNISQSLQPYSQYAQLQDYNYNLPSTVSIRYSGSYLRGSGYNTWSVGDISYGTDPVINYYSSRLGLFTQIQSSSFIPGVANASLGYLADVTGGLFELNQNNKNWVDVQNIFVEGTPLTVKQFDNKKYSNQVITDGIKTIYNSGYNYTPELYFSTLYDPKIYFQFNGAAGGTDLVAQNTSNYSISGGIDPRYSASLFGTPSSGLSKGYIYNIFDVEIQDTSNYYTTGNSPNQLFPTYSVPFAGTRQFNVSLPITVEFPGTNQEVTYSFIVKNNGTPVSNGTQTAQFRSTSTPSYVEPGYVKALSNVAISSDFTPILVQGPTVFNGPFDVYDSSNNFEGVTSNDSWISASSYIYNNNSTNGQFAVNGPAGAYFDSNNVLLNVPINYFSVGGFSTPLQGLQSAETIEAVEDLTTTLDLSLVTDQVSYIPNDKVTFELLQVMTASNANFTSSISSTSTLTVVQSSLEGNYPFASTASGQFIKSFSTSASYGVITLTGSLGTFYNNYQQVPYFVSGSPDNGTPPTASWIYSSSLYVNYGDVNTLFAPQPNDKIILKDKNNVTQDLNVYSSSLSGSQNCIEIFTSSYPQGSWVTNPTLVSTFLLLRRYEDEQNVIMRFNKPPGATSYGFILPNTISPQVVNNINTLQANVQAQLLSTQASANISTL